MTEAYDLYLLIGRSMNDAIESQLFGKPCFKINGKPFVSFFQDSMVFKLTGDFHKNALAIEGAQLFDPSGKHRPMKEWVQIPFTHSSRWTEFAQCAFDYVIDLK